MTLSLGSLLCWSSSPHSEAVYSLDHHCITKGDTSGTARWELRSGQSVGEGAELPCPLQAWLFPQSSHRKPYGPCLLWGYGSFSTLAPLIKSVAMGDGFDLQALCPPCRSGWDWKLQPSHHVMVLLATSTSLSYRRAFWKSRHWWNKRHLDCFPSSGDSKGFQSSVQEAGVRPNVCFFLKITTPQLMSQSNANDTSKQKQKQKPYFKMLFDRMTNISKTA